LIGYQVTEIRAGGVGGEQHGFSFGSWLATASKGI
jgi:hypothetical protein